MIVSNDTSVASEKVTLSSNTGLNSQPYEIGIDWLDFSLRNVRSGLEAAKLVGLIGELVSDEIDFSISRATFNGHSWCGSGRGIMGTMIWWQAPELEHIPEQDLTGQYMPPLWMPVSASELCEIVRKLPPGLEVLESDDKKVVVSPNGASVLSHGYSVVRGASYAGKVPGILKCAMSSKVLSRVSMRRLYEFLATRDDVDVHRFDVALDDMRRVVELDVVESAARLGDYFDVNYVAIIESGNRGCDRGKTVYFGSPSSDKRMRVYDKTIESKSARDCIRWEVEYRRKKAFAAYAAWFGAMSNGDEHASSVLRNLVIGAVDFRDRSDDDKNRERCDPLGWWVAMKGRVNALGIKIRVAITPPSLQKSIDWVRSQVAQSVAAISVVLGSDFGGFMDEIVSDGKARLNNARRLQVHMTDKQQLCY